MSKPWIQPELPDGVVSRAVPAAGHYVLHYDLDEKRWWSVWFTIREWDGTVWFDRRLHMANGRLEEGDPILASRELLCLMVMAAVRGRL